MKAKLIYALSALVMVATMLVTSCSKDGNSVEPAIPVTIPSEFTNLSLESGALNKEVQFVATTEWNVTLDETTKAAPSWLKVSPMSGGAGSVTLNVEVEKNTIEKERSSDVTINAGGEHFTISVKQKAGISESAKSCDVTFDANGGDGGEEMTAQEIEAEKATALTPNAFTRTDYKFLGWNTKADGSGSDYADGADVTLSENLTLYAQWKLVFYTIAFDANGGEGTMESQKVEIGELGCLNETTFTRPNYKFIGWNTKADGEGDSCPDKGYYNNFSSSLTLYAQWLAVGSTDLMLADIDADNVPEGYTWSIADTDVTADDDEKFAGLKAALKTLDASHNVDVVFPNLMALPAHAFEDLTTSVKWTFSAPILTKLPSVGITGANNLTEVYIPKATYLGIYAIGNNESLVTLTVATEGRVETLTTQSIQCLETANVDLITHTSNVDGLKFKCTNNKLSTDFKSVNGQTLGDPFPADAVPVAAYSKSSGMLTKTTMSAVSEDGKIYDKDNEDDLEYTSFFIGYDKETINLQSKYTKFGDVTWSSSETDDSPYLKFTPKSDGSIGLELLKALPAYQKTVTFTATAPDGDTMSFKIILKGESLVKPGI